MRLLHLSNRALAGYSENDLKDLDDYFLPNVVVTSNVGHYRSKKLEKNFSNEIIPIEEVQNFKLRSFGQEVLLILREKGSLNELRERDLANDKAVVITDLVKKETDPMTFDFELKNAGIVDSLHEHFDSYEVLSTEIEAEDKQEYNGKKIHGLDVASDREGVKIPVFSSFRGPRVQTFPADRVGLLAVSDMGVKFSKLLKDRGITCRSELKENHPLDLMDERGIGPYRGTKWVCSAEALEEKEVYRIRENDLKDKHRIFLDIETDSLRPSIVWHIGIYDDSKDEYISFLQKDPEKKADIIERFGRHLEKVAGPDSVLLAWYGSGFDFEVLEDFFSKHCDDYLDMWQEIEKVDLMNWAKKYAVLPCRTSKLENVAERLGYERDSWGLTGEEVAKIYSRYMNGGEKPDWEELETYAKDDVISLKHIYDVIEDSPLKYDIKEIENEYRKKKNEGF